MGSLRITGGCWRGQRITCPVGSKMRPTSDVNRQRLFNWLGDQIIGLEILDLFAGSGILSLEALSRGAARATLVELDPIVIHHLYCYQKLFKLETRATIITAKLPMRLARVPKKRYDLVFIDPPFGFNLAFDTCQALVQLDYLTTKSLVYLECEKNLKLESLLATGCWQIVLQTLSGNVAQYLLRYRFS